jgi:hypothetical protein
MDGDEIKWHVGGHDLHVDGSHGASRTKKWRTSRANKGWMEADSESVLGGAEAVKLECWPISQRGC